MKVARSALGGIFSAGFFYAGSVESVSAFRGLKQINNVRKFRARLNFNDIWTSSGQNIFF